MLVSCFVMIGVGPPVWQSRALVGLRGNSLIVKPTTSILFSPYFQRISFANDGRLEKSSGQKLRIFQGGGSWRLFLRGGRLLFHLSRAAGDCAGGCGRDGGRVDVVLLDSAGGGSGGRRGLDPRKKKKRI